MSLRFGSIFAMCIGNGKVVRVTRRWLYLADSWPSESSGAHSSMVLQWNCQACSVQTIRNVRVTLTECASFTLKKALKKSAASTEAYAFRQIILRPVVGIAPRY